MIKCPKCQFEQPPDRYCAQCGVNMETFKAPRPPLSRQLAGSGAFLGFLIGVVILATAFLIYNQQKSDLENQTVNPVAETAPAAQVSPPQPTNVQDDSAPVAPTGVSPESVPDSATAGPRPSLGTPQEMTEAQVAASSPITTTTSTSRMEEAVRAAGTSAEVKSNASFALIFAEVPQSLFAQLFDGANELNQTGTLPDLSSRMGRLKDPRNGETVKTLARYSLTFEGGVAKHAELLGSTGRGLSISVATRGFNPEFVSLEVMIENKGLIAGTDASEPAIQNFQGVFDLPPKSAGYFADLISKPTGLSRDLEAEISRSRVFQILNSPNFIQRQSALFIFLENGSN